MKGSLIEFGVAMRALPGEADCGDLYLVKTYERGALVAVVDGLGHGTEAAEAAKKAVEILNQHSSETAIAMVKRCHAELPGTRGAVMSLASFNSSEGTVTWLGVGNVEGVLIHADSQMVPDRESLLLRGGVVGSQLPALRATVFPVFHGDLLVFATDGISMPFDDGLNINSSPQEIADRIMEHHGKSTDDALVLAARYLGNCS